MADNRSDDIAPMIRGLSRAEGFVLYVAVAEPE
jgi:hypothetical protein